MDEKREEFARGWNDCRNYAGEESNASKEYKLGFSRCLEAYHNSVKNCKGWSEVPTEIPNPY